MRSTDDGVARPDVVWSGSGAEITMTGDLVTKRAASGETDKLVAEGAWLRWVGSVADGRFAPHFPEVVRPADEHGPLLLRRLPGRNARAAVLDGREPAELLERAVVFAFADLAAAERCRPSWATGRWCEQHLRRSLASARRVHPELDEVLGRHRIPLGGVTIPNPLVGNRAGETFELVGALRPPQACSIHGDLHLGNLIVDAERERFSFVDPRGGWHGRRTFDPAYDVAKLLHEPHYVAMWDAARTEWAQRERFGVLARTSLRLAAVACRSLRLSDPFLPARATLITGVLLLSILRLPRSRDFAWWMLFDQGMAWLAAGRLAVRQEFGLGRCRDLWTALAADPWPDGLAVAGSEWTEMR